MIYLGIIILMLVGVVVYVCFKTNISFVFKAICTCFLSIFLFAALTLFYNAFVKVTLDPLPYPSVEMGTEGERKDSKAYFEVVLDDEINPQAFVSSVQNIIDSPTLVLPFDNPELMLADGVRSSEPLPVAGACLYVPVLGNLKEHLSLQLQLVVDDLDAGRLDEAQERVYLLLALGNRYLKSDQLVSSMMGLYICGRVLGLLRDRSLLTKTARIRSELEVTARAEVFVQRSVLHDLRVVVAMIDSGFTGSRHSFFDPPIQVSNFFNRKYIVDYYNVLLDPSPFSEKIKSLERLRTKAFYMLQIPTYYTLSSFSTHNYTDTLNDSVELGKKASEVLSLN
jgi:hypothetical protein